MTRKDYQLIAKAIVDTQSRIPPLGNPDMRDNQLRGVRRAAARLADALAQDNPAFNADLFLKACGYGATTMNKTDPALDLRPLPNFTVTAPLKVRHTIGTILRDRVEGTDSIADSDLSKDEWTLIEEIATGFENA